ncbi:MAG: NAD(P)-dependent oxidoreductase [Deltaproteobacteria bacterium]|nr:NAD(P)-dependent oxidoreductase [Deltaproteobacteria bacterium]
MRKKKRVVIIGGAGVIGTIIIPPLSSKYEIIILDIKEIYEFRKVDISNYKELIKNIPGNTDVLINLAALPVKLTLVSDDEFRSMVNVYVIGSYNVFLAASQLKIKKVVFASSNHVTGYYEKKGKSISGKKITTLDYPLVDNVYGAMKLFAEQSGRLFSEKHKISVICLRIATVVEDEINFLLFNDRSRRTILSHKDTVNIFAAAIDTKIKYGVYYAVSDNPENPWDIQKTMDELGNFTEKNSSQILN